MTNVDGGGASTAEAPLIFEQPRQHQNVFRVGQTPPSSRQFHHDNGQVVLGRRASREAIERGQNPAMDWCCATGPPPTWTHCLRGKAPSCPCSFWLADSLVLIGRRDEGKALFERLLALRNDLGSLAEEYDPHERRMLGNFPQALTHMALINTARLLSMPVHEVERAGEKGERAGAAAHPS